MFLHLSVSHSVHRGGGACHPSMHCRWNSSMPCSRGVCYPSMHCRWYPLQGSQLRGGGGSTPRGVCSLGVPASGGVPVPGGRCACSWGRGCLLRDPLKQTATVADGTHPTGMHSCYLLSTLKDKVAKFDGEKLENINYNGIFSARQRRWGKVMFSAVAVCLAVHICRQAGGKHLTEMPSCGLQLLRLR